MSSDIKNEFEEYVKTLTETICNDIFLEKLEQICHEYEDGVKPEKLKKRFARYENFSMTYIGTHEKVLCIDERYTLVGSYNLLSYDGGEKEMFQGYHFRFEGGVMIDDAEFAKHVIKEIGM